MASTPASQSPASESSTSIRPPLPLENATAAIGNAMRWKLLAELAKGEPLMVSELAARVGKSPTAISKQLIYLRYLGAVEMTRRLHHIARNIPQLGNGQVDFGYFVARFDVKG